MLFDMVEVGLGIDELARFDGFGGLAHRDGPPGQVCIDQRTSPDNRASVDGCPRKNEGFSSDPAIVFDGNGRSGGGSGVRVDLFGRKDGVLTDDAALADGHRCAAADPCTIAKDGEVTRTEVPRTINTHGSADFDPACEIGAKAFQQRTTEAMGGVRGAREEGLTETAPENSAKRRWAGHGRHGVEFSVLFPGC